MPNNRRKTYRVISLFSGCGGTDLGFRGGFNFLGRQYQTLPFEIVWANDADEFATSVYKHNLGLEIDTSDVTRTKFEKLGVTSDNVDVLVAGFPCQDFSLTGPRHGLESHRGRLYREIRRALYATQQLGRGLRWRRGKVVRVLDFVSDIRRIAAVLRMETEHEWWMSQRPVEVRLPNTIVHFSNDQQASFFREWLRDAAELEDTSEQSILAFPQELIGDAQ